MDFKNRAIRVSKCVIGETYYLTGGWYKRVNTKCYALPSLSVEDVIPAIQLPYQSIPLINTPLVFKGKNKNVGKQRRVQRGQFIFMNEELDLQFNLKVEDYIFIKPQEGEVYEIKVQKKLNKQYSTNYGLSKEKKY